MSRKVEMFLGSQCAGPKLQCDHYVQHQVTRCGVVPPFNSMHLSLSPFQTAATQNEKAATLKAFILTHVDSISTMR
jgi:hypothetical protein